MHLFRENWSHDLLGSIKTHNTCNRHLGKYERFFRWKNEFVNISSSSAMLQHLYANCDKELSCESTLERVGVKTYHEMNDT